jgi:hypothetical protein
LCRQRYKALQSPALGLYYNDVVSESVPIRGRIPMSQKLWKPLAAIAALAAFAPAHAQMRYRGTPDLRADERGSTQQQQQAAPPPDPQPRQDLPPGKLTPEERRQLRQDIHNAGREIYRGGPQQHPLQR